MQAFLSLHFRSKPILEIEQNPVRATVTRLFLQGEGLFCHAAAMRRAAANYRRNYQAPRCAIQITALLLH